MKTLYNNYCNSKQGYLLLLISQFVTNQICSHVTDLLSFVSLAFCAIRQERYFCADPPVWEYTDTFHIHVFLPANGKCFHGRSPQTHFCFCLMDGYDRSSFFIAARIAALVIGSYIRHHLPAFRVQ